jgi:Transposase DDE domain
VIVYRLSHPGTVGEQEEIYRLITTILHPAMATAAELAALYPQRWEIEPTIKEGKTILRKGRITLRSKMPELVRQEFWGMILAHYLIIKIFDQAALDKKRDPDEHSYEGNIQIIKSTQTGSVLNISL